MLLANTTMHKCLDVLSSCGECTGLVGYAIARNKHKISDAVQEYLKFYNQMLAKYGEPSFDDHGNVTGYSLSSKSPNYMSFIQEITPVAHIEEDVDIYKVPMIEAAKQLNAQTLEALYFMLED